MPTESSTLRAAAALLWGVLALAPRGAAGQASIGRCGEPATPISSVQGYADVSPLQDELVVVEATVSADFRAGSLAGVFVQEEAADDDADPSTSEGLFVYGPASQPALPPGSIIRVLGKVSEWNGLTELSAVGDLVVCPGFEAPTLQHLTLPVASRDELERFEGMLVQIAQTLTVTGNFELGRYGSLDLSAAGRLYAPTQLAAPGVSAARQQASNDRSRIVLDDASATQNPSPTPYLDNAATRRVGAMLTRLTGIVDERYGAYRVHPAERPEFTSPLPRPTTPPAVGGSLRVASLNVFNYFTSLDNGQAGCGPDASLACRGANSALELERQRAKLVTVLAALDADVVGLFEIQNDAGAALRDLVAALNARLSNAAYEIVDTGSIGGDAIKTALLFRSATVAPIGAFALLTSAVDTGFADTKHRPVLAQTFTDLRSQARFTLVLAHLKSKSSTCSDLDDPDINDGQGACNRTRTAGAQAIVRWLATDPTHAADPDVLVLGDLNAYAKEDPIAMLEAGGLRALVDAFLGPFAYSYQFNGQSGYLDHALASASLAPQVTGLAHWHINADEPALLDYNTEWKTDDRFDARQPFRASDHDPLLVGLCLTGGTWSLLPTLHVADFLARVRAVLHPAATPR